MRAAEPLQVGNAVIDALHDEMVRLLAEAIASPDEELHTTLGRLQAHCYHHFSQEETLMVQHRFGGIIEHRHEHRNMLGELQGMVAAASRGRISLVRAWLNERLPEWFTQHVANFDSVLATWLVSGNEAGRDMLSQPAAASQL